MAVLPLHGGDRGSSQLLTRPRTLALAFVVFFLLFFWMFFSGGPLVPSAGPYKPGKSQDNAHAPPPPGGWDNDKPPPPPSELDGHGSQHGHAGDNHNPKPPSNSHPISYTDNDAAADTEHAWPIYEEGEGGGKWTDRAGLVKGAFKHAWGSYERKAWGKDELKPMSGQAINNFNGWGVTIIDSLDTLVLMGLKDEFNKAMEHVANVNVTGSAQSVHFFETVIRYLGGYLSAYHLTSPPEPILLTQASALGNILLRVFDTPSGLPGYSAPTQPHEGDKYSSGRLSMYFAEVGSCQLEFKYLAHLTGDARYWKAADKVTQIMKEEQPKTAIPGLFGTNWDINSGKPSQTQFTIGALSDSAYEYLLKQYLLSGRTEKYLLEMYIAATDAMIDNTLYLSPTRNLLYVTDVSTWKPGEITPSGKLEHLSCFLPGLFALGADQLSSEELDETRRKRHRWAAEGLAYTCYAMYAENRHGLGPEDVQFKSTDSKNWGKVLKEWEASSESKASGAKPPGVAKLAPLEKDPKKERDYPSNSPDYFLRPESIESVYLLWKTTKDEIWRERGWTMWEAVDKETRVENGFANAANLNGDRIMHSDQMPSYFFAETLKYYYLLFSNAEPWPLNKYVFNTEAHPLPVYHLREWERRKFGVDGS